ncbi:hypothetical protein [Novosphingobium sp. KACC 22771]|uniref:hypothetical protein n=1 Tax=Novosphingobium sp. KACC 22771 TaxID=3025670 RepID=UPI0023660CAB|nr:hypothetical protein [Novosphingobium sp. KACC 22771]WDF74672.1 hypothetical protein PQ467_22305 [Novosphingobium sp. KACC 22771]
MALVHMVLLSGPQWGDAFTGSPYNALNGAMWTIRFEFRCYLLTYLLGMIGILKRPRLMLWLTGILAITHIWAQLHPLPAMPKLLIALLGKPDDLIRLTLAYMAGSCFRLLSPVFNRRVALVAALLLVPAMFSHALAETALVLLGGYGLLYLALCIKDPLFLRINARDDISYGVYLYAWPIGKLLFWYAPGMNVWLNAALTACLALAAGWISWKLVEQPAMRLGGKRSATPESKAPSQNSVLRTLP